MTKDQAMFISTLFRVGNLPGAPGTWGSLASLLPAYLLHWAGGFPLLVVATIAATALGVWTIGIATAGEADPDHSEIVIDELAGQWIALWPLSAGLWFAGVAGHVFPYPGWIGAFLAFRLFDIWKPWPVSWADQQKTPFGVMFDDVLAGVYAAILVGLLAWISHGLMGL